MKYDNIWQKMLSKDEKIEHEFSISDRYIKIQFALWIALGVLFLPLYGAGVIFFIIAFLYKKYVRVANAYAFTNKRILIHRGWLSTKTTSVDYDKITDVHVNESFSDRFINHTGHIGINTAGSGGLEIILSNIAKPYELKKKLDALKDK